ncbi:farnesyl pyrophosphate synthase-like isoform X2 [Acanthaster planci]|uniref:Farnesyl pyrophosphate synthase n=1 Tax=Acanthaster planci TaxID=133434 RepID=A0A8B7YUP9_ACAPL|nr:farnesyl pyrophosphate synthase-like isoform X2 [Acanthaster planci]
MLGRKLQLILELGLGLLTRKEGFVHVGVRGSSKIIRWFDQRCPIRTASRVLSTVNHLPLALLHRHGINMNSTGVVHTSFTMADYSKDDANRFHDVFKGLLRDITEDDAANPEIQDAALRFEKMMDYNIPHGKRNRGLTTVASFRYLASASQATDANLHKAMVLGWCVEWLQAYFLIADDIMDQSKTRRGRPCWFRKADVGLDAINDSFFVEAGIYKLLKKHIGNEPYYVSVLELFHETTYQTVVGQSLDLITSPEGNKDLNRFTQQRYDAIVKWKTAFYSFYLPVALAMYMVGITDAQSHRDAKTILLQMGHFFQIQDDFLDCYGNPEVIGKIGTDIEENKCSWLVVQALKVATAEQRELLEENYGIDNTAKVAMVKKLYKDLDLETLYHNYEESSFEELMALIDKHSGSLPKEMFVAYARKIFKREK